MSAQIVLDHYLEKYQTSGNTLTDISFNNLSFLQEEEPIYNNLGQKVSKSYLDMTGKEAVRIEYFRIIKDYTFEEIVYPNVFQGLQKVVHFLDWAGEIAYSKNKQMYKFKLDPLYEGGVIVGFTSRKMRDILRTDERNINI
jgi:hypothetical protein